jgi:hypothetical protein
VRRRAGVERLGCGRKEDGGRRCGGEDKDGYDEEKQRSALACHRYG